MRTPKQIYERMRPTDRKKVASESFRRGTFNGQGDVFCLPCALGKEHPTSWQRCDKVEFQCEALAAIMLVPRGYKKATRRIAKQARVETWVVRFRRALGGIP